MQRQQIFPSNNNWCTMAQAGNELCRLCNCSFSDRKSFGKHLWDVHHLTPDQYRVQVLGIGPKCCNPECANPVPRSTSGGWHKACSPSCALKMRVDIPLPSTARAAVPHPSSAQPTPTDGGTGCFGIGVLLVALVIGGLFAYDWIYHWDWSDRRFPHDPHFVISVAFSSDGRWVLSNTRDDIRLWDLQAATSDKPKRIFPWRQDEFNWRPAAFTEDHGRGVAEQQPWDQEVGALLGFSGGRISKKDNSDRLSRNESSAQNGSSVRCEGNAVLIQSDGATRRLEGHTKKVDSVAISLDGKYVVSSGEDNALRLWIVADGTELKRWDNAATYGMGLAFATDGRRFATIDHEVVRVYSVAAAVEIKSCIHRKSVTSIAFSRDGRQLLTGCYDNNMRLWNLPD